MLALISTLTTHDIIEYAMCTLIIGNLVYYARERMTYFMQLVVMAYCCIFTITWMLNLLIVRTLLTLAAPLLSAFLMTEYKQPKVHVSKLAASTKPQLFKLSDLICQQTLFCFHHARSITWYVEQLDDLSTLIRSGTRLDGTLTRELMQLLIAADRTPQPLSILVSRSGTIRMINVCIDISPGCYEQHPLQKMTDAHDLMIIECNALTRMCTLYSRGTLRSSLSPEALGKIVEETQQCPYDRASGRHASSSPYAS